MANAKTEKIGNVTLDFTHYPGEDFYCDGASEDELLAVVRDRGEEEYPDVIRERHSWELLYHLSDLRENIVEWLPLDKSMKVLEVGAGCGAITGSLARRAGSVTCVELSKKRSTINALRHRECDNITIHVGNFSDIEPELSNDYDYVCLIGVFEYAQSYMNSDTPFVDFYHIIKKHVKPGGRVVIAIENKMGLKYWAGCREDHLGTFFSGLEDYPEGGVVRTFTKGGLERILQECGEREYRFYYPYPDYKFMTMVYSDGYLPRVGELSNNLRNFDRDRMLLFDEKNVFDMLIREGLFPLYSNSYLVVTGPAPETLYSRFSNDRAAHLCIRTEIGQDFSGKKYVRKHAARKEAQEHIHALALNYRVFEARFAGSTLRVNRLWEKRDADGNAYVELEFLENAVTLEELLDGCLQKKDADGFFALLERYRSILEWNAAGQKQNFDLIFSNICVQGDVWTMIDYEWAQDEILPEEIAQRALYCYGLENRKRKDNPIVQRAMERLGMDERTVAGIERREAEFQRFVMQNKDGRRRMAVTDIRHLIGNKAVPVQEYFAVTGQKRMQVFEDFGEGYSAEHSYYIEDSNLTNDKIRAEIICREKTAGIRLDPAEEPCLVRVEAVTYCGRRLTGEQLGQVVVTNGTVLEDGEDAAARTGMPTVLFEDADPNINIRLDALDRLDQTGQPDSAGREDGGKTDVVTGAMSGGMLVIEARIARLSAQMLADIRAKMTTGRKRHWFRK